MTKTSTYFILFGLYMLFIWIILQIPILKHLLMPIEAVLALMIGIYYRNREKKNK